MYGLTSEPQFLQTTLRSTSATAIKDSPGAARAGLALPALGLLDRASQPRPRRRRDACFDAAVGDVDAPSPAPMALQQARGDALAGREEQIDRRSARRRGRCPSRELRVESWYGERGAEPSEVALVPLRALAHVERPGASGSLAHVERERRRSSPPACALDARRRRGAPRASSSCRRRGSRRGCGSRPRPRAAPPRRASSSSRPIRTISWSRLGDPGEPGAEAGAAAS